MEVIDNGLQGGYADAILLDQRVKSGEIRIIPTKPKANVFQSVLDDYGIEAGDKDLLWLCRQMKDYEFVVVDDRLLYIVLNRFQMQPRFLPDVLVWFAQRGSWSVEFTRQALNAVRPRYRRGFITHSLALMEGNL